MKINKDYVEEIFQSTPHAGATRSSVPGTERGNFNPRPHAGATSPDEALCSGGGNFNPRPHAGATVGFPVRCPIGLISIHAPMRGRRAQPLKTRVRPLISIHAPMRGRPNGRPSPTSRPQFQSTPPCGGDVSDRINALVRGFQSTPPCGGDGICRHRDLQPRGFQSTPPCGGDGRPDRQGLGRLISIHAPMRGRRG